LEEIQARIGVAPITDRVAVHETPLDIQFISEGTLRVDGRTVRIDVAAIQDLSLYSLLLDNASYEVVVDEREGVYYALVRGQMYRVKATNGNASDKRPAATPSARPACRSVIRAPLCGLVVDVPAQVGQPVQPNQVLVVLESMKMENEILAPSSGVVREVRTKAGAIVREGDILAIVH
jgi:biotin carboxyl carrier protein